MKQNELTIEEVGEWQFKFASHISMEDGHISNYSHEWNGHTIILQRFVRFKNGEPVRRSSKQCFICNGNTFKTAEQLVEYLNTSKNEN